MNNDFLKLGAFLVRVKRTQFLILLGLACVWAFLFRWINPLPREMGPDDLFVDFNSGGKGQMFVFMLGNLGMLFAFATTLGILLNKKTSSTWLARLPFSRAAFFWVPVALIALFGALLFGLFSQGWIYVYELSAYPLSVLFFCFPLLVFAIVRSIRGTVRGVSTALLVVFSSVLIVTLLFVGLIKSGASLYSPFWISTYANLFEVLVAGLAIWAFFVLDRGKESLRKRNLILPLVGLVTITSLGYRQWQLDSQDPAVTQLQKLRVEYKPFSDACDQMKKQGDDLVKDLSPIEPFKTREEWIQAFRVLKMYPLEFRAKDRIKDFIDLANMPRPAFITEMFAFRGCNPAVIWGFSRKVASSLESSYLTSEERIETKKLLRQILTSEVRNSNTLIEVASAVVLAELMVEHHILNESIRPELSRIQESIKSLKEDLRRTQGYDTNRLIFSKRTQQAILQTLSTEVVRSGQILDRLNNVLKGAG